MEYVTLEKVLADAEELSTNDQRLLRSWLDAKLRPANGVKSLGDLMIEQGVKPRSFEEMLGPEPKEDDDDDDDDAFLRDLDEMRGRNRGRKGIEQLMREQGTRPLKFEEMLGDFWPEDENVDDFVNAVREMRQQTEFRSLE